MKRILLSALVIAAMTSCAQKSNETEPQNEGDKIIQARSEVAHTKAVQTNDSPFDFTYVLAEDAAAALEGTIVFNPIVTDAGQRAANGTVTFQKSGNPLTYNKNNNYAYFRCFAPRATPVNTKLTWTVDGITDVLISDIWSAGNYSTPVKTGLEFKHALSQIEVTMKAADGQNDALVNLAWGKITSVTVENFSNELIYDISTKAISYGTPVSLQLFDSYDANTYTSATIPSTSKAMITPSNSTKTLVMLKIVTEKDGNGLIKETTTSLDVTLTQEMIAGSRYGINILFSVADKPIAGATSTVEDWVEGGSVDKPIK